MRGRAPVIQWHDQPHAAATQGLPFLLHLGMAISERSENGRCSLFHVSPFHAVEPCLGSVTVVYVYRAALVGLAGIACLSGIVTCCILHPTQLSTSDTMLSPSILIARPHAYYGYLSDVPTGGITPRLLVEMGWFVWLGRAPMSCWWGKLTVENPGFAHA